ncbi:MAG: SufE family protein [Pseudomonadota bacterium]
MTSSLDEICETFDLLGEDWDERYRYIIELGRALPPMAPADKTPANKVRGCASQVWMSARLSEDIPRRLILAADSDAHIVRGLIAILLAIYNAKTPREAAGLDARAILDKLKLANALSPTRTNGLHAMVARIQDLAHKAA